MPLYLLDITGSSAIYGAALACSMIPVILLSPIGGVVLSVVVTVISRSIFIHIDENENAEIAGNESLA